MRLPKISTRVLHFFVQLLFVACVLIVAHLRCSLGRMTTSLIGDDLTANATDSDTRGMNGTMQKSRHSRLDEVHIPPIFTLHFEQKEDRYGIEHNCVLAAESLANMVVITDNTEYRYCDVCRCEKFKPANCPSPSRYGNNCEKLSLVQRLLSEIGEFIYLDSDLVVMKATFFHMFASRTHAHDFVAPLAEAAYLERPKHENFFNSGLMFIRAIPGVNHSDLMPRMYRLSTGSDQSIITYHVRDHFLNYDSLSLHWHCRRILRYQIDIRPRHCITVHDRNEIWKILNLLNFKLRKAGSLHSPTSLPSAELANEIDE